MIKICVIWDNPYDQRKSIFRETCRILKKQYRIPYTFTDISKKRQDQWKKFEQLRKKFQVSRLPAVIFYDDNRAIVFEGPAFEDKKNEDEIFYFLLDTVRVIEDEDLLKVKDYMVKDRLVEFLKMDHLKKDFVQILQVL